MGETDYSEYRRFLKDFATHVDLNDQLPVRLGGYSITENEIPGEIIDWTVQYLSNKNCPPSLFAPIIRTVMDEIKQACHKTPSLCGYSIENKVYQPLKLMHAVTAQINNICLRLLDNSQLDKIPPPPPPSMAPPRYAISAVKNTRRKMEDRHVVIDDFNGVFGIENSEPTSYYAIFDGHGGQDAASYTVAHLHQHIAASKFYPSNPTDAIRDAFLTTDLAFLEKCKRENLCSGTTALCVLYRPLKQTLHVGWVGDSQALLVRQGNIFQIVKPHKPELESERKRIESQGGHVMRWGGLWRVNGTLAISRAIGDADYKPFVTGEPDITRVPLDGMEDFLIIACDGLWDFVTEDDAAITVYRQVRHNPDNIDEVTQRLVKLAKLQGSADNISVIVVFLKDPHQIATSNWPSAVIPSLWDYIETAYDKSNTTDAFGNSNLEQINPMSQYEMMDFECKTSNGTSDVTVPSVTSDIVGDNYNNSSEKLTNLEFCDFGNVDPSPIINTTTITTTTITKTTNGKRSADELDDDDDLGPETDVDALDEIMMSPKEIKEDNQFESKEACEELNDMRFELNNPFNPADLLVKEEQFKIDEIISDQFVNNPFEDNKLRELIEVDETKVTSELVEELLKKDLSEKRDNSFEKDEFDSEMAVENVRTDFKLDGLLETVAEGMEISDLVYKGEEMMESIGSQVLETSVTEHVAESGGEDSEDEWNYIKGDKTSETKETINVEQSHAISQGIAESQEACSDLLHEEDQGPEEELLQLEKNAAEEEKLEKSDKNEEEDDEDNMSSQLNPDAKEFVPTSPVRSTPNSPLNTLQNGTLLGIHPQYLYENDAVISQSPRKGTPMDNIAVPSENEFDIDISSRPAELEKNTDLMSGGDFNRPGSSCSQASYQEMNLKEAMHGDEKLEYAPETEGDITDRVNSQQDSDPVNSIYVTNSEQVVFDPLIANVLSESDPMNMSFYQDKNDANPFDMNAIHPLPVDDEDDVDKEIIPAQSPYILEGQQGQRIFIEDSDFGMNDKINLMVSPNEEISKPEEDMMYSPVSDNKLDDFVLGQNNIVESDQPESELLLPTSPILQAVQEMTTEVTSLLNTVNENNKLNDEDLESPSVDVRFDAESFVENIKDESTFNKYVESGLSPTTNDFVNFENEIIDDMQNMLPESDFVKESLTEDSAESDNCLLQQTGIISPQSMEPQDGSYTTPVCDFISEPIISDTMLPVDQEMVQEEVQRLTCDLSMLSPSPVEGANISVCEEDANIEFSIPTSANLDTEIIPTIPSPEPQIISDECMRMESFCSEPIAIPDLVIPEEEQFKVEIKEDEVKIEVKAEMQEEVEVQKEEVKVEDVQEEVKLEDVHEEVKVEVKLEDVHEEVKVEVKLEDVHEEVKLEDVHEEVKVEVKLEDVHEEVKVEVKLEDVHEEVKLEVAEEVQAKENEIKEEVEEEKKIEPTVETKIENVEILAAAVAVATIATTATIATKKPAVQKGKVSDIKKTEPAKPKVATMSKTAPPVIKKTTSVTSTAPKTSATTKSSVSSVKSSTATTTTTTSSSLIKQTKPSSTTTTTRPKSVLQTASPTKSSTAIEKKTTSSLTTARKPAPLTNGDVKPAAIKKLTLAPVKAASVTLATKSTTAAKPLSSARTTKPTTTSSKPAAPATTYLKPATTTKAPAIKPTTLTPKTKPLSSVSSLAATRSPISPTKPKTTTSGLSTSSTLDKQIKDTTNKQVSSRTLTTTNKLTLAPRSNVTTVRKTEPVKSPIGTKLSSSTSKTTTTTTTTTVRSSATGTKKPTAATRTNVTKKTTSASSPSKPISNDNKTIGSTTTTTVTIEKLNGEIIGENEVTKTSTLFTDDNNKRILIDEINDLLKKDESPVQVDNSQMIIIDSAAD